MSDVMGSINLTNTVANGSRVVVPTPHPPAGGWGSDHSLSLAFVNFVLALLTLSVRYASVFWYTNKALTVVFALQLLALTLTAALGYSAWCCLYKVCYNRHVYINVTSLSLGCSTSLALYVVGGVVALLSTMTIFEYGSHYFAEKLRIIERKHHRSSGGSGSGSSSPDSFVKQTLVINSGCQGYVPHSCAMAALVALACCKGPVLYDLVALYRPTQDRLVLAGLVAEVLYLVLWIALWFALTVKQRWQFRILDYVPLGQPLFMIQDDQIVKNPCTIDRSSCGTGSNFSGAGGGGSGHNSLEIRGRRRGGSRSGGGESPAPGGGGGGGYASGDNGGGGDGGRSAGDVTPDHDPSEAGTEDSDNNNANLHNIDNAPDIDCLPNGGGGMRKTRPGGGGGGGGRRQGGQRVTFDDCVHSNDKRTSGGGGGGGDGDGVSGGGGGGQSRHLQNVKVDVHNNVKTPGLPPGGGGGGDTAGPGDSAEGGAAAAAAAAASSSSSNAAGGGVKLRKREGGDQHHSLTRDYRNSIRSKCDDFYAVVDHPSPNTSSGDLNNLSAPPPRPQSPPVSQQPENNTNTTVPSSPAPSSVASSPQQHEPLPTLMSSFRDKVKESSRTANTLREQRRNLQLGGGSKYGSTHDKRRSGGGGGGGDGLPVISNGVVSGGVGTGGGGGGGVAEELERQDCDKRRGVVDGALGELTLRLDDSLDSGVRSSQRTSTVSGGSDNESDFLHHHHHHNHHHHNLHHPLTAPRAFSHVQPNPNPHHHINNNYHHHKLSNASSSSGVANNSMESESSSLPSIRENGQLIAAAHGSNGSGIALTDKPPRQAGVGGGSIANKMDYLSIEKGGSGGGGHGGGGGFSSRNLHIVPRTKGEIGRRDSANYSLTSSQETSSNDSDHGQGLCSQNGNAPKPK